MKNSSLKRYRQSRTFQLISYVDIQYNVLTFAIFSLVFVLLMKRIQHLVLCYCWAGQPDQ